VNLKYSALVNFDKVWCGYNQVPASLLFQISGEKQSSLKLASFRFFLSIFLIAELVGYFLITFGLAPSRQLEFFICGVIFKIVGEVCSAFFQNRSGTFLSIELQKYLKSLKTHAVEIRSLLADSGCTESEIHALYTLPRDVYQSELNGYQRARILNVGAPITCGLALLANGDVLTAGAVILLGLLSFPIGERFFKENTFRRESELRIGLAAQLIPYVEKIYREHVWLTTKVNFLSQLPLLLFLFRFLWNGSGYLLSSFFGLTQGLMGLTGSLAFQKARVTSMKTTETTKHLIHALSSPFLIVTPQRWKEHCANQASALPKIKYKDGILLDHFSPNVPFEEKGTHSISTFIPFGSVCLLRAPSGKGKTTLLAALNHLIEHTGNIFILTNGQNINVHHLTREDFDRKIFLFREDNIESSARLIDLFKNATFAKCSSLLEKGKNQFDPLLVDLAWKAQDNLLEQEIKNIENHKHSTFPEKMLVFLIDLRKKQIAHIKDVLKKSSGNLDSLRIYPERNFSTLSSGEKRRVVSVIALEMCSANPDISLVILDEPLTHLDKTNIDHQLQTILQIQNLCSASILLISHHFIDEMKETLPNLQEIHI
jgi:energy-coupling factor transporter ATP-binding protein EcfA2